MTARCFPDVRSFESDAERVVWQALRDQLPDDAVLWSNLSLSDRKGDSEADLVVLWPGIGVATLEVKGGHITRADDGSWVQVHQDGRRSSVDPVRQAKRTRYALRDFIRQHSSLRDLRMTHLVAFPFTVIDDHFAAPECPRWMILDSTDVSALAAHKVESALRGVEGAAAADHAHVDEIIRCLTARPGPQRELLGVLAEREHAVERLTSQQSGILHQLRSNPRILVRGGAGTGKSFLAVEQARRLSREGQRVAFVCYSRGLASFVRRRFNSLPPNDRPAYVGTFHNLGVQWGAKPLEGVGPEYWESELPIEMLAFAAYLTESDRFDAIVVDEAQDFADSWWPALLAGLRDPTSGGLTIFLDNGQRVFGRQGAPPDHLVKVALDENLRNTKQIAQAFGSLASEQMRYLGGNGQPVRLIPCTTDDAVSTADDAVVALMDAGWPPQSIALLTTGSRHPVQVDRVRSDGTSGYWESFWDDTDAFYGSVLGFKGLERPAVVLAVNGFREPSRAREMLYVGMSRARDLLIVCGDPALIGEHAGEGVMKRLDS